VCEALKHNSTLTTLGLLGNGLGPEGARIVCETLKHNTTLTALSLADNGLGPEGARFVCEALKHNTTLTTLWLNDNRFGCEAMKHNSTVTTLYLSGLGDEGERAIAATVAERARFLPSTFNVVGVDFNIMAGELGLPAAARDWDNARIFAFWRIQRDTTAAPAAPTPSLAPSRAPGVLSGVSFKLCCRL